MNLQNRLLRLVHAREQGVLIASDVRGRVHKLSYDLELLQSSPVATYDKPVNALCVTSKYVFTKDRFGAIGKWDLETLQPLDFYDGKLVCDVRGLYQDEEPSPSPNRAMAVLNGRVYTLNGYNQLTVLDAETFEVLDIRPSPSETFLDCICAEHPTLHAVSDVAGFLYIGNLETNEFPVRRQIDTNVVHGVAYDKLHDRFWTTQDAGLGDDRYCRTGVTCIEKDGSGFREFKISHEDNEFIAFEPEGRYLYIGGFQGRIHVFDNTGKDFAQVRVLGPLEFQIIHACVVSKDHIYALLQTGDIVHLDTDGVIKGRTQFPKRCVWTMEPHPTDPALLYAGTDQGVVLLRYGPGRFGNVNIEQVARHDHGFGMVKDVRPAPDGSYVAIARQGDVFKVRADGAILWRRQVLGIPRSLAISADFDRCLVATDSGTCWELDTRAGAVLDQLPLGGPSYGCAYASHGRRVFTADNGQQILVFAPDSHVILGSIRGFGFRLKRLVYLQNGELFAVGPDGLFELDLEAFTTRRKFGDYMVSTKENGAICKGFVYVGGYGYQLATYEYETGEIVDLKENLPDFSKAFALQIPSDKVPILLVGGRSGFVSAYRLYGGVPQKVREFYVR